MAKPAWLEKADPVPDLDRWLLECLDGLGAVAARDFVESSATQTAGGQPRLTVDEVDLWFRSADRRGLLEFRTVDAQGRALHPPLVGSTSVGRLANQDCCTGKAGQKSRRAPTRPSGRGLLRTPPNARRPHGRARNRALDRPRCAWTPPPNPRRREPSSIIIGKPPHA